MVSAAVRYDRGSPTIAVVNRSRRVRDRELQRVVRALQKQIDRDFFPLWGWRANLVLQRSQAARPRAMKLILANRPDEEDALGYHFLDGVPLTYVFTEDERGRPVEWHSVASHEALEMIADPGVNLYADGFYRQDGRRRRAFIAYEVCDPVQGDGYRVDGIRVSDFVVPEWFEPDRPAKSMQFSFCGAVAAPFQVAPRGYVEVVVGRRILTVFGRRAERRRRRHRLAIRAEVGGLRR
jgi:hypothetical protein